MSADNGIYIHKFSNGWRVAEAGAIENIFWDEKKQELGSTYNQKELKRYFGSSPLFKTEQAALNYAWKLSKEIATEYGIQEV
jgi:hypothetical protein